MGKIQVEEKRFSSDILVVGGGIAGLTAAVAAKEANPDASVIVVEKQVAGYGGKANKGGGVLQYFDPKMNPRDFVEYHTHNVGCYLGNQLLTEKYVAMNNQMIDRLDNWGITIPRNMIPTGPMTFMVGIDLDSCIKMTANAKKLGCQIFDKVAINDLLTKDGKVAGAVGYSLLDGTWYVFEAKAVVMATGSQNYRSASMWSNGRGDGIAAAYRAGAEMRNAEFGNFGQLFQVRSKHEVVFGENNMYNALDQNVTQNFRRFPEADISASAIREWYEEMSAGRGPIYLRVAPRGDHGDGEGGGGDMMGGRKYGAAFWAANHKETIGVDVDMEVAPGLVGEQSPIKTDINMATTLPGLYAAGDSCYCGSGASGAVPAPPGRNRGSGILNAVFAGIVSGEAMAEFVKTAEKVEPCEKQIAALKEAAYAPLEREEGVDPIDIIDAVQEVVCPAENTIFMSQHRLDVCLRKLNKAKAKVPEMKAKDWHELCSCHEAAAMVLSAEMQFKASSMRQESRGWFLREDFPVMDNKNWLKWVIVKNVDGEMTLSTEDVPIQDYPVQVPDYNM
ncbi:MAG: FAD-binding protein [Parasporobacterium sp.]|nr:FAD-binding protein [Parasporobacterium sp.]